jgi:hypothetical protein
MILQNIKKWREKKREQGSAIMRQEQRRGYVEVRFLRLRSFRAENAPSGRQGRERDDWLGGRPLQRSNSVAKERKWCVWKEQPHP